MYEFNYWLLEHLDEVTGIARSRIGLMSGKSKDFMRHVLLESHDIKMGDLMDICDALRIGVGNFFYLDGTEPVREVAATYDYKPAKFDMTILGELLRGEKSRYEVPLYKIMNAAGNADCRNRKWTKDIRHITARDLVKLCNGMRLGMHRIVACPMKSVPAAFTMKQLDDRCAELCKERIRYDEKYGNVYAPKYRAARKAQKQAEAAEPSAAILENIQQMLVEMQRTQQAMQQQIDALTAENRHLREMGHIGLAASPKVGYEKSGE